MAANTRANQRIIRGSPRNKVNVPRNNEARARQAQPKSQSGGACVPVRPDKNRRCSIVRMRGSDCTWTLGLSAEPLSRVSALPQELYRASAPQHSEDDMTWTTTVDSCDNPLLLRSFLAIAGAIGAVVKRTS